MNSLSLNVYTRRRISFSCLYIYSTGRRVLKLMYGWRINVMGLNFVKFGVNFIPGRYTSLPHLMKKCNFFIPAQGAYLLFRANKGDIIITVVIIVVKKNKISFTRTVVINIWNMLLPYPNRYVDSFFGFVKLRDLMLLRWTSRGRPCRS